ncbi:MAG: PEP-CTERM sorting domain-containing protein [Verrucomicrobiota bacterium]
MAVELLYHTDFTTDPFSDGWVPSFVLTDPDDEAEINYLGSPDFAVEFTKTFDDGDPEFQPVDFFITRTFTEVAMNPSLALEVNLEASQNAGSFEGDGGGATFPDFLQVEYSTDNGGSWDVVPFFETPEGSALSSGIWWVDSPVNGPGNTTPTPTDFLALNDPATSNNPALQLRIHGRLTSTNEIYFLNEFSVRAVPEPSRVVFLFFGIMGTLLLRRRRERS